MRKIVTISLPDDVAEALERHRAQGGKINVSKLTADALRERLAKLSREAPRDGGA
jgi:metal-responsive CopG/Arc/MetJ family transcriptional regulator